MGGRVELGEDSCAPWNGCEVLVFRMRLDGFRCHGEREGIERDRQSSMIVAVNKIMTDSLGEGLLGWSCLGFVMRGSG